MGVTAEFAAHLFVERAEVLEQTLASRAENLAAIISLPPPQ
jgi:primosomal protein N''